MTPLSHGRLGAVFSGVLVASTAVGPVLLGLAILRSNPFPETATVLIAVGAVTYAVGPAVSVFVAIGGIILFAIGGLLTGLSLWQEPVR
jgi:hypothetical protein